MRVSDPPMPRGPQRDTLTVDPLPEEEQMTLTLDETHVPPAAVGTMKAAVVHSFTEPLTLEHVEIPTAGVGEIVVRVEASGLCHTDIHAAHGDWPVKPSPPFTPGHEGVGIVVDVGPGVVEVGLGDRVAM